MMKAEQMKTRNTMSVRPFMRKQSPKKDSQRSDRDKWVCDRRLIFPHGSMRVSTRHDVVSLHFGSASEIGITNLGLR
jgi:hypothetical protein